MSEGEPAPHPTHVAPPASDLPAGENEDAAGAAASLAARLGELADTMPERERQTLAVLLLQAMDPVARRRWQPVDHLRPDELALLERLAGGARDPGTQGPE